MKDTIKSKIPFVGYFSGELEKASNYMDNTDFLKVEMPAWSFDLGAVKFETQSKQYFNVREAYEPYRIGVRSLLALIVYGLGAVYLVRYFLNYGPTISASKSTEIDGQMSLFK